jgi:hypothetical protein
MYGGTMLTIDVKLMSDGREVSENEWAESLTKAALENVKGQITDRLGGIVCPVHGQHLQTTIVGQGLDDLNVQIGDVVKKRLKKEEPRSCRCGRSTYSPTLEKLFAESEAVTN